MSDPVYDFDANTNTALQEIQRQTEIRIEEQLQMSTAADQRAMTFLGLLSVVLAIFYEKSSNIEVWSAEFFSFSLIFSAVAVCGYSAKPTRLYSRGASSDLFILYSKDDMAGYLTYDIFYKNDKAIAHNDRVVRRSARIFMFGMVLAGIAFLVLFLEKVAFFSFLQSLWSQ